MRDFTYTANPARVLFRSGSLAMLPDEAKRLDASRILVLSTQEQHDSASRVAALLGSACVDIFPGAVMHTPVATTEQAVARVAELEIDAIVAIGGGSTIGLSKAIALRTDLPQIVVPTTYAGSEVTPIIGETRDGLKTTQTTLKVLPEVVIYDVDLTLGLPRGMSVTSGMNAIAHAVEALYARDGNPIIDMMAVEGVGAMARSLPLIARDAADQEARSDAQYAAWLCGTCLGAVGMSLHHKLCHTLGGRFNLPHAETHSILLPHALNYNAPAVPAALAALASTLDDPHPAYALYRLAEGLGAPLGLRDLGMPEGGIDEAADLAMSNPYWNPRPLERDAIRGCIAAAWAGEPPQSLDSR
ncbi:maleylacetate reductase [Sphingobium sp.]|uniref:maleylacetate reductase n=1 Tax=Sphingobium sp. TaxID=1912891 RepID=UPI0028BDD1A4|nr:maleylacetate reductase [Sphingobium sp.]